MLRGRRIPWLALVVGTALAGCSSESPTLPEGVPLAQIALTVSPSPLVPTAQPPLYSLRYTVKIAETTGLGGELQYVNGTVFDDATGNTVGRINYDSADLVVFVGSKRLAGNASLEVQQQINYSLPAESTKAILTVNVQLKDDRGNFITQSILVRLY
jgi:hypothetical protein